MRRVWTGLVVALLCTACSSSTKNDGGTPPGNDSGNQSDGGCSSATCPGNPDGGLLLGTIQASPLRVVMLSAPGVAVSGQFTLNNTGSGPVNVTALSIAGTDASSFGVSAPALPVSIPAGEDAGVTVTFNGPNARVYGATLTVISDAQGPQASVSLRGLASSGEPSLQWILDAFEIPVNTGDPDPTNPAFPTSARTGLETGIQSFVKAGDGPVTTDLLGSFGPNAQPVSISGWYPTGNAANPTPLVTIPQAEAQVLSPQPAPGGLLSFDPGSTPFGLWSTWPFWYGPVGSNYKIFQEDSLNTWDTGAGGSQHHMRVFPFKNPDGTADPHSFVVTTEEAPFSVGPDFNDLVLVIHNVAPAAGTVGSLTLENLDIMPAAKRMSFNVITTIPAWQQPLTVKNTGVLRIHNTGGSLVNVKSVTATGPFQVAPSVGLPAQLYPTNTLDLTVTFTATDGRVNPGSMTITSDDPLAPTLTVALAGFRQVEPQSPNEPTLSEIINQVYGFKTVIVGPGQDIDNQGRLEAVGDEVLSPYWVKADQTQRVGVRMLGAWHTARDHMGAPANNSYLFWFKQGGGPQSSQFIFAATGLDDQRLLPRLLAPDGGAVETPDGRGAPAVGGFDPGTQAFGVRIENEYSDEALQEQEPPCPAPDGGPLPFPCCPAGVTCGHRVRFWPYKDVNGALVPNSYIVSVDWHVPGFTSSNYDYNDEIYLFQNMTPAPK
jgi:hypothetical protein